MTPGFFGCILSAAGSAPFPRRGAEAKLLGLLGTASLRSTFTEKLRSNPPAACAM